MTYEETLKRIQAQYDSAIAATLAVISKTKPLTKKKLTEQLLKANRDYWSARLAELDEVFVTEAEQASAALSALYLAEAETFSKRVRSIYANYERSFNIPQSVARELLKNTTYERSVAETIKATVEKLHDGEEKERMLAEMSAPAYRYRMQRVEQLTRQAEETCSDIAKAEINTDRVFLQTQTEKAYNITVEGLSEPTPAQRVLENLDPTREFTPTTDKGIFDSFSLTPTETVREIVATDWSGRSFSDRVWHNTDEVARSIKEVLVKGELTGASEAEMAAQVAERFNVGMFAARRVVRTESNYCTNQAELKGYIAAGYEKYEYAALIDDRTSDICKDLDGKIFDIKDATVGVNYPPMHPFCRSSVYPVIETAEDVQRDIDEMIDSWNIPEGMSFDEFVERVNNGELEQIREEQEKSTLNSAETVDKSLESGIIEEKEPLSVYDEYEQNREAINETLHQVEKEKEQLNYEVGTIIDRHGNIINVTGGEAHKVNPPKDLLIDNIFTHNHPSGGCFSFDDIKNAIKDRVLELRASTPQGIYYSLVRTKNATDNLEFANEYKKIISWTSASKMISSDLMSGIISKSDVNDALYVEYASRAGEAFLRENAEKYGYVFTIGVR